MIEIKKINLKSVSKVSAIVGLLIGIFMTAYIVIIFSLMHETPENGILKITYEGIYGKLSVSRTAFLFLFPLIAIFYTFLYAVVCAVVYNWVAKKFGGIKFEG